MRKNLILPVLSSTKRLCVAADEIPLQHLNSRLLVFGLPKEHRRLTRHTSKAADGVTLRVIKRRLY
ncbi:hypothetical protein N7494_005776 [Penicillium frequentans]|uniref:Uncharacterized protein n=1 Tax=Penicillium frequentans TaxID=3151616 RepID=A0AAD6CXS3_9EURO|nr:hypothetical protein N7494_005776 [Penicillium glabrum]